MDTQNMELQNLLSKSQIVKRFGITPELFNKIYETHNLTNHSEHPNQYKINMNDFAKCIDVVDFIKPIAPEKLEELTKKYLGQNDDSKEDTLSKPTIKSQSLEHVSVINGKISIAIDGVDHEYLKVKDGFIQNKLSDDEINILKEHLPSSFK